jgi:hypothetical protein
MCRKAGRVIVSLALGMLLISMLPGCRVNGGGVVIESSPPHRPNRNRVPHPGLRPTAVGQNTGIVTILNIMSTTRRAGGCISISKATGGACQRTFQWAFISSLPST